MTQAQADERRALSAVTLAAALLIADQVAARALRDTLFLSAFHVRSLPLVMIAAALVALGGAELLALALARRSPSRAVPGAAFVSAVVLLLLSFASLEAPRLTALVLYLHVAAFGGPLVSGFWSLVNERFDPYTARRVVGRIGTGATAGGVIGGVLAWVAAHVMPVAGMLPILALLHASFAFLLLRSSGTERPIACALPRIRFGGQAVLASPYLRQLALLVLLGAAVEAILDFVFKAEAARRYEAGAALLGAFALFHGSVSVASLLLQAAGARSALQQLGIAGTVALRPLLAGLGSMLGAALPRFATATFARGAHESLTNSLFRSGYELLYTPVSEAEKRRVKPVIDVALDKVGALVGSALVLAALAVREDATRPLFLIAAAFSFVTLSLSRRLHRGYVNTLERSLLAGRVRLDPSTVFDRATQLTLAHTGVVDRGTLLAQIEELRSRLPGVEGDSTDPGSQSLSQSLSPSRSQEVPASSARDASAPAREAEEPAQAASDPLLAALHALRSGKPASVRRVARAHPDPPPLLVGALIPLLAMDEAFTEVLKALRRAAPRVTGQLVDVLLDRTADAVVRRRVARVLNACPTPRAVEGLRQALDDESFEVRSSAAAALATLNERSTVVRVSRDAVLQLVRRELDSGEPVDRQAPLLFALLSLAIERQPLQIAWAALKGGEFARSDRTLRGTALEYLSNVLPEDVFGRLLSVLGASSLRPLPSKRPAEQVAEELRSSSAGLRLEQLPWREGGEG